MLREHELDALVTPSYAPACPIDLVNAEAHPGACTSPTAMAGYPLLTVPTELARTAGRGVLLGHGRQRERRWSRSRTATWRPGTAAPARSPEPTFPTFVFLTPLVEPVETRSFHNGPMR